MSKETNSKKVQDGNTSNAQPARSDWKALLEKVSYSGIVSNVPFLAFVVLLCVLYISSNKRAVETQRELNKLNDTLKELRWDYMDAKSQMMYAQMEIEVIKNAADIGLKPMLTPAFKIAKDTVIINTQPE